MSLTEWLSKIGKGFKADTMKIGFIGTGAIASAMVRGIAGQEHEIWVSNRNDIISSNLEMEFDEVTRHSNEDIAAGCDVIFLCLMANIAKRELSSIVFRDGVRLISVMVDMELDQLAKLAPTAKSIDITIPLPQIASGGCPLPCYPSTETVSKVFGSLNPSFVVRDLKALNAHFAASALMSTTLDQIKTGASWLEKYTGDLDAAQFYISHMLASALRNVNNGTTLSEMLIELSTEGGLNAALKEHMQNHGSNSILEAGLNAFKERLGL